MATTQPNQMKTTKYHVHLENTLMPLAVDPCGTVIVQDGQVTLSLSHELSERFAMSPEADKLNACFLAHVTDCVRQIEREGGDSYACPGPCGISLTRVPEDDEDEDSDTLPHPLAQRRF